MRNLQLKTVLVVVALACGIYFGRDGLLRHPAPAFSLPEVYGGRVDLSSFRGRPVLLVFWTTSCSICQRELPMLSRLEPDLRSKGVAVLAIHLGGDSEAADYLSSNSINLSTAYDADGTVGRAYSVGGVPKLVLIDENGNVKRVHSGWTNESTLRNWVD